MAARLFKASKVKLEADGKVKLVGTSAGIALFASDVGIKIGAGDFCQGIWVNGEICLFL